MRTTSEGFGIDFEGHFLAGVDLSAANVVATVFVGALMVSNVRFYSFKDLNLRDRVPFVNLLVVLLIFLLISTDPPLILFLAFLGYAISGSLLTLIHIRRRRLARNSALAEPDDESSDDA
jgi:CDP-diacylglycerol--serine O-phosphatidyltransferase